MGQPNTNDSKWGKKAMTPTVEFYHNRIRELVAERFASSGKPWNDVVVDPNLEFTKADFEKIEAELLATGYRFEMSAQISQQEEPDKYKSLVGVQDSGNRERDEEGREVVGTGDNVFNAKANVIGTARMISNVEIVMEMLINGVPDGTIAIIDDSGGTLTAPILEGFAGVVCMGGTVRSHLGILTREYGVPCLMAAELDGLNDGDTIEVEFARQGEQANGGDSNSRRRIWKIEELGGK
ncbi:PEP-utilizing enzyme [Acidithrix sp. C25]|uniref:PEP-utilizing enzyme n=1 Tax=Acidithrix sp. C25 TaxID=1671482 RepID=UPI00191B9D39|nr:PEP-utilizing enzyme [Acidithrix sp. C25]CAG4908091.1 unnamed protein product [Acidithrix sp. C25]